ncbi:MAG: D-alanyl-D-alanine carboxypeptidase [Alphaproteobacteria bacterium]|jgi:D-alanyl-D-alanine carboxypeptidase|nr:D-alanyl-D-alanine carboxypeptidase [Alphaproteobacteria bacterium]QQS57918.1 MAG: D-alanyl-D-alanine carboxypeptidase [Alphaproteobacteria bacterium]
MPKQMVNTRAQGFFGKLAVHRAFFPVLAFAFLFFCSFTAEAASKPRYTSLVIDAESGVILHQSNAHSTVHPASLTKMMTLMMLFEALDKGRLRLNDRIRISDRAASMVPSKIGLKPGATIRVEDAIYALVTKSANDIAVAVAEHLGKTESNFARMMTRTAQKRGMTRTVFKNASGLHDPGQITSAADMAKLAHILIYDYPRYYKYFSKKSFTYLGKTYKNHNRLMDTYPGMDGLKTGYIQASGYNLVASAVRGERRLIGVVFGGRNAKARNLKMEELLNEGFVKAQKLRIARPDTPKPLRKPEVSYHIAETGEAPAANGIEDLLQSSSPQAIDRWAALDAPGGSLGRIMGEGDADPTVRKRLETGLIAVSALTGASIPDDVFGSPLMSRGEPVPSAKPNDITAQVRETALQLSQSDWSIQIGAFSTRERTDKALATSLSKLPQDLRSARVIVAPLKTPEGWVYRGRLSGYTHESAAKACTYLEECIPIPPDNP